MPLRARGTSGRGGGGLGRTRPVRDGAVLEEDGCVDDRAGWVAVKVDSGSGAVMGEEEEDAVESAGEEAHAMASSMSSSERSHETLMQRPTRRTVVSSGREKWL